MKGLFFITLLVAIIFVPVLAGDPVTGEKDKKQKTILMGTSADYPPYEFYLLNEKDGDVVGLDIDIAKEVAKALGVKLVVKNMVFSELFNALEKGEIDFIMAGISPTEKRKKIADFSIVYFQALQNMLIRAEDKGEIKSIEDLRGKRVGTQKESIQSDMVRHQVVGAYFLERYTIKELVTDLKKKRVDAVILEKPVAESYVKMYKGLTNITCRQSQALGAVAAVKKGNKKLLDKINTVLKRLIKENKIREFAEDAKMMMDK